MIDKSKEIKYFRDCIWEAKCAYNAWKMIVYAQSSEIVGPRAHEYVAIQNYHPHFFQIVRSALLTRFTILLMHVFEKRKDSLSLIKIIAPDEVAPFMEIHQETIDKIEKFRHERLAHRKKDSLEDIYQIPSVDNMTSFFHDLEHIYNKLSSAVEKSSTYFQGADDVKRDIELLYMNLERGEVIRKKEIDIKWLWEEGDNQISKII